MKLVKQLCSVCIGIFFFFSAALPAFSMTAAEILEEVAKKNFSQDFRLILTVKTMKGKKPSTEHSLWIMGKMKPDMAMLFIDFEEPADTKGLRFLVEVPKGEQPKAYMYLPATGNVLPLAADDPSVDLGGTGLTMEDMQGFVPERSERLTLMPDQKYNNQDCYVVKVARPEEKAHRLLWISKKNFIVVKSESVDAKNKVTRIFRVTEIFETREGKEYPREEEIVMPGKDLRIIVRQEHASFGVELPDELFKPETFGAFQWRAGTN
jgi:hypothetical protein